MDWLGAFLLLSGALLCLVASIGVLRLPDFFMRMHAATKAGVAGSGLVLLGVAALDGSVATWIKVTVALIFLLLTTPVAGHLIGRAGYVSGHAFWRGTREDALSNVLPRGEFGEKGEKEECTTRVVLLLADGPHTDRAIQQAIELARKHDVGLCGVALIDVPRLQNVGPVPIGAGWHAQQMREHRIAQARRAAADVLQKFEVEVRNSGVSWSGKLLEGTPRTLLREACGGEDLVAVPFQTWFDHGVLGLQVHLESRLDWPGKHPLRVLR